MSSWGWGAVVEVVAVAVAALALEQALPVERSLAPELEELALLLEQQLASESGSESVSVSLAGVTSFRMS